MVYDRATTPAGIDEDHPTKPASPYAASKLAGEALTLSYHHAYGLPTTVVRPFNTYGPFQRSVGEGGVVAIFTRRSLLGEPLRIYGDGTQTRDLLYVEDCARFVVDALVSRTPWRAGSSTPGPARTSRSTSWPRPIEPDPARIVHVEHIHPQSEIAVLRCDSRTARDASSAGSREVSLGRGPRPDARLDGRTAGPGPAGGLTEADDDRAATTRSRSTAARPSARRFLPYAHQQISDDDVGRGRRPRSAPTG